MIPEKRSERTETGSGSGGCRGRIHRRRILGCPGRFANCETEYTPWSQREEVWNTTQNGSSPISEESEEEPEMEDDSMETDQPQEDSVETEATATGDFHLTDDDLSDTKDEELFFFSSGKTKKSREEDK